MYDNTLTVLTFSVNIMNNIEININHTMLQLHMSAEVYLCGILHVGECEEKFIDAFQVKILNIIINTWKYIYLFYLFYIFI